MTKDDIIRMLHEAGYPDYAKEADPRVITFANLVAAAEREACAKVADKWSKRNDDVGTFISSAIRARSQS